MQRTLLSRPNLDNVIRMTDLELQATSPEKREAMANALERKITVSAEGKGKNLFSVTYEGDSPQLTLNVVQSLLTIFVESNLGANRTDMDQARKFIEGQILDYERQLKAAEARLANFKVANLGVLGNGNYTQTVDQARGRLGELQAESVGAEEAVVEIADGAGGGIDAADGAVVAVGDDDPPFPPGDSEGMLQPRLGEGAVDMAEIEEARADQRLDAPRAVEAEHTQRGGLAIDEIELASIGRQGEATLTAEQVAERLGTINYEVVSEILARVPRVD